MEMGSNGLREKNDYKMKILGSVSGRRKEK
jgi:hypothetical protein